ncbi:hypothetical protein [Nonomuraea basaltis]|uniref:hypothetical protein n=1 Tax=Nonomuraea basaltis TaxID=2495887 RepID=UPI00110C47CB|nr:hypothetical protein [Nonomuraea basaltis]TMR97160.1 hypothetical protein EJK15_19335 [Nonomuraea basaltis]
MTFSPAPEGESGSQDMAQGVSPFQAYQWMCGPVTVLDLAGSLTGPSVSMLQKSLAPALARRSTPFLVVDVTKVQPWVRYAAL